VGDRTAATDVIRSIVHLTWRLDRFEVATLAVFVAAFVIVGLAFAANLVSLAGPTCELHLRMCGGSEDFARFYDHVTGPFMAALAVVPFAAGTLLGVSIVAPEIERRTGAIAWSLTLSRVGWFAWRTLPLLVLLVVAMLPIQLVGDRMNATRYPLTDPSVSWEDYGVRGPLVVGKALAAFGIGAAVGAWSGRVSTALIATAVICLVLVNGAGFARERWLPLQELPRGVQGDCQVNSCIATDDGKLRMPDGRYLWWEAAVLEARTGPAPPGPPDSPEVQAWLLQNGITEVSVGITGDHMPEVEMRELACWLAAAGAGLVAAAVITGRRRIA
jgi:hypothetical protein